MNSAVANVLNKVLGDFIDNLNPAQLNLSVFKGKINLKNLSLKPKVMDLLALPFKLKYGLIGKIDVDIPWSSLASSPLIVNVEEVIALVSPKPDRKWSQEEMKQNILQTAQESLDAFDALNHPELTVSDEPGYFAKLIEKIVDNVQVNIKKVYVRYEDHVTAEKPFCIGIKLLEVNAVTCNENWHQDFVSESNICYKFVGVKDFGVFLDYDSGIVSSKNTSKGTRGEVVYRLMNDDFANKLTHKYIIHPVTIEIKIIINKQPSPGKEKLVIALNQSQEIKLDIQLDQVTHIIRVLNYLKVFDIFRAGVMNNLNLNPMADNIKGAYRSIYLNFQQEYIKSPDSKSTEKAKSELMKLEQGVSVESIKQERNFIIKSLKIERDIERKQKEIDNIEKEGQGTMSKMFDFFSSKSSTEKQKEQEDKKRKIDKIQSEIDSFKENRKELEENKSNLEQKQQESSRIKILLTFTAISLQILEGPSLVSSKILNFLLSVDLSSSLYILSTLKSLEVVQSDLLGSFFPFLIKIKPFEFDFTGDSLKFSSQGADINANLPIILSIIDRLVLRLQEATDLDKLISKTTTFVSSYISSGQHYMKSIIKEGTSGSLLMVVDLKAPIIYIPGKNPKDFLVIDLGTLLLKTESKQGKHHSFESYLFKLQQIRITKAEKIKEKDLKSLVDLLLPADIQVNLRIYSRLDIKSKPMFKLDAIFSNAFWKISINELRFVLEVLEMISKTQEKPEKAKKNSELVQEKLVEVVEVESFSDSIKNFGEIQPWAICVSCKSFSLDLIDDFSDQFTISIEDIELVMHLSCKTRLQIKLLTEQVKFIDKKVNCFKEVLQKSQNCKTQHLRFLLDYNPEVLLTEVSIALANSEILVNKKTIDNLLSFVNDMTSLFPPSVPVERVPKTFTRVHSRFVVSIIVQGLILQIPLNPEKPDSNKTGVSFTCFISYSSITSVKNFYDNSGNFCLSETIDLQDEACVQVSHLLIYQQSPSTSSKNTLLKPSRLSLTYSGSVGAEDLKRIYLNTESLLLDFSFYDLFSIQKILALMIPASPPNPEPAQKRLKPENIQNDLKAIPKKLVISLDNDSLQVNLINDTGEKQKHVLHVKLSNLSLVMTTVQEAQEINFSTLLCVNCFNRKLGAWEPLVEDWKVNFLMIQKSLADPLLINVTSENNLEVNFNSSILSQVSDLIKCLSFQFSETSHLANLEKSSRKSAVQYRLVNELDRPVTVWLNFPNNNQKWEMKPNGSQEFSQSLIDQLFVNSNPFFKSTSSVGLTQPPATFNLEVEGFDRVSGLGFEEADIRGFSLISPDFTSSCALVTSSEGLVRTVRLMNGLQISNNSAIDLQFSYHGSLFSVPKEESKVLPVLFQRDLDSLLVKNIIFESLITGRVLIMHDQAFIVECFEYQVHGSKFCTVEINPSYIIQNLLPGPVSLKSQGKMIGSLDAGKKSVSNDFASGQKIFLICETNQGKLVSLEFELNDELKNVSLPDSNGFINVEIKEQDLRQNSVLDLGLKQRTKLTPGLYSSKIVTFYIETIILNKTGQDLVFVDQDLNKNSWIIFNGLKGKVRRKEPLTQYSKEFSVDTISLSGILNCANKANDEVFNFGVLISTASSSMINTKIIKIVPRYLLSNLLGDDLFVQVYSTTRCEVLKANSSSVFEPLMTQPSIQISDNGQDWSGPFKIEDLGDFQIRFLSVSNKNAENWTKGRFRFIRVLVSTIDEATIRVNLVSPQEPEYLIRNNTNERLEVTQLNFKGHTVKIKPGSKKPWTFDSFLDPEPKVTVSIGSLQGKYSLDKIKNCRKLGDYFLEVTVKDSTRVLEVRPEVKGRGSVLMPVSFKVMKFEVKLTRLGVSISDAENIDMLYISLTDIQGKMKTVEGSADNKIKKNLKYDLKVQNFQIDNMYTNTSLFPVILNKHIYKKDEENETPFLQLKIYTESTSFTDDTPSFDQVKWFEFCLQPISVKINEETIYALINLKDFFSVFSSDSDQTISQDLDPVFAIDNSEFSSVKRKAYFEFFRICGVKLEVTFRMSRQENKSSSRSGFLPLSFLRSFGKAFTNISSAPISFKEILIAHGFQTIDSMTGALVKNLVRQAALQVFSILGSSDLIGNPVGLIDKLGTGVFEFVNEPAKGLLKGPKAFAQGVGKGVRSLVGSVVAGSFESISKISGSLYNVLNEVGGDHRAQNEPENCGVVQQVKGGVLDIASGITGVFTKPFKGAKEQGAKGFFKGVGTGLFGLVSTPFKIVLKIGSTLTSGIAKGATLLAKGQVQTFGRVRFPRQGDHKLVLEPYNNELAQAQELVRKEGGGQRIVNYSHVIDVKEVIFIITDQMIWVLNGDEMNKLPLKQLENMQVDLNGSEFLLSLGGKGKTIKVTAESFGVLASLYYSIVSIVGTVEPWKKKVPKSRFCS